MPPAPAPGAGGEAADGLPAPQRQLSALAIAIAIAVCVLDASIANIALPALVSAFDTPPSRMIWAVNAYQLTILALLLPMAALGESIGFRRVYAAGLAVFIGGAGACALAPDASLLIAARVFQGIGAAAIMSINGALVRHTYPVSMLGRGVGLNALVVAASAAAGPALAAGILSVADWRWLFAFNVPIGIGALALAVCVLPGATASRARFDWTGAALNAAAFVLLFLGIDKVLHGQFTGWITALAGAGLLAISVWRARARPAPILPVDLLRVRAIALAAGAAVSAFIAQALAMIALPFLMHVVFGRSLVETGLMMVAWPVTTGMAASVSGRLAGRVPSGLPGAAGMTVFALALAAWAFMPANTSPVLLLSALAGCGIGFGLFQSPNARDILLAAPRGRSGGASGLLASGRLAGQTTGAVLMGGMFHLAGVGAPRLALGIAALFAVLAALVSLAKLRGRPHGR